MKATRFFLSAISVAAAICFLGAAEARQRPPQDTSQKPAEKVSESRQEKSQEKPGTKPAPKLPAEIELLETHIRFETDGSSRKEVHARVKINDELGVRQFARLNFDFNRSFEQIEIPLVRIIHPSGGVIDVLPSAITDNPNPAVVNAPAYQDVRVKSVRILGLEPGDSLEYRVITSVSHHPLAPDFWLEHTFDRSGVVSEEHFELDLPTSRKVQLHTSPAISQREIIEPESRNDDRVVYRWQFLRQSTGTGTIEVEPLPDITVTTFASWKALSSRLEELLTPLPEERERVRNKAAELAGSISSNKLKIVALYDFVSKKVSTVDLPLGAIGFHRRAPAEILSSRYATQEDKFTLLAGLASAFNESTGAAIVGASSDLTHSLPNPSAFTHLLVTTPLDSPITPGTGCADCFQIVWLDPSVEVASFGMIAANFRGKSALRLGFFGSEMPASVPALVPTDLPFPATQHVKIDATLSPEGALTARVKYTMRGDNELLLRMAFHQSTKEKWDGVAQLLALSDGFRGKVSKASASDPYETQDPFTVSYEITQAKFVDWSKKSVNVPAILPLLGLPDQPSKPAVGAPAPPIDLGTPLDVEVTATVHLPPGTTAHIPTGTSVARDFATYTSQYSAKDATLSASRHLNFILKQIPADRAADYNAFLRAVQNDESQVFTLERSDEGAAKPQKP